MHKGNITVCGRGVPAENFAPPVAKPQHYSAKKLHNSAPHQNTYWFFSQWSSAEVKQLVWLQVSLCLILKFSLFMGSSALISTNLRIYIYTSFPARLRRALQSISILKFGDVCVCFFICLFVYSNRKRTQPIWKKIVFTYKGMDHESDMGYNIRSLNHNAELQETRLTVKNGVFWTSIAVFGEVILWFRRKSAKWCKRHVHF